MIPLDGLAATAPHPLRLSSARALRLVRHGLREARPAVQLVFLTRFASAAVLTHRAAAHQHHHPVRLLAAGAGWVLATIGVYLLNGACDVVVDRVNGLQRPVALGLLTPGEAARLAYGAAAAALTLAVWVSPVHVALTVVYLALGWAYSAAPLALRRWNTAGAVVGGLGTVCTYAAGVLAAGSRPGAAELVFTVVMTLWMAAVGSQAKDLSDVRGDRAGGRRTVAARRGARHASRPLTATALLVGALAVAAAVAVPALRTPAVVLAAGAVVLAVSALTGHSRGDRTRRRRPYRIYMTVQFAAHAAVLLAVAG